MTTYIKVKPSEIQKELDKLEEEHKQNNQLRACLFNLILYTEKSHKAAYFTEIIDKITLRFPCRIIVIEQDMKAKSSYLNTSVSAKFIHEGDQKVLCDKIHIEAGAKSTEQVHHLLLPHLIPDLPIYLFWGQDPTLSNPLFPLLSRMAQRLIFESECCDNLNKFTNELLSRILNLHWEVTDLNWIRLYGWRQILKGIFNTKEQLEDIKCVKQITLNYCGAATEYFSHNHFQVHYLHSWLAAQLNWSFETLVDKDQEKTIVYRNDKSEVEIKIMKQSNENPPCPGLVTSVELITKTNKKFIIEFDAESDMFKIQILDENNPDHPYNGFLKNSKWEVSLAKEIFYKETSLHYCNMLKVLSSIEGLT